MNITGDLIQDLNEFSPLFDNSPPVMDELLIPYGDFRKKFGSHIEIVQEPVPLTEALVVADEIRHIDLIQLAQDPVDQLSTMFRSSGEKKTICTMPKSSAALRIGTPPIAIPFALFFRRCISIR